MKENPPILSRIVTCFRQWDYIEKWCSEESLFEDGSVEWIVINDDPDDPPTEKIKSTLDKRGIQLISPRFNLGMSGARNYAANIAKGVWLDFIDGDDLPLPIEAGILRERSEDFLIFSYQRHRIVDGERILISEDPSGMNFQDVRFVFKDDDGLDGRVARVIWRGEKLIQLGGFDARYDGVEDLHSVWKVDQAALGYAYIDLAKQSYFIGNPEATAVSWRAQGCLRFFEMVEPYLPDGRKPLARKLQLEHASLMCETALSKIQAGLSDPNITDSTRCEIGNHARNAFWKAKNIYKNAGGFSAMFRIREAFKLLLGF